MLGLVICVGSVVAAPPNWEQTLGSVVPAVVVIRTYGTRTFDTEVAHPSVATGFIVDRERGIILTNRHVVQPGPTVAEAHLQDNEELPLQAIYRDPVHDFGFFRFDPDDVRFMDVVELELDPSHARVGAEIRLVGNDAGEKISILDGTLARIDRPAPDYGRGRYNDFNTFYYQAASGTSGGSSGSPVIDMHGRVIALNAGSKRRSASSFFLPLDRVVRALEKIQAGEPVNRGTLQVTFVHATFDEVQRLGLQDQTQTRVRQEAPDVTGLLTVRDVLPGGPAADILAPGDVIVGLNGRLITDFIALESILDEAVGEEITMSLERGGAPMDLTLTVADLHTITPDAYMEIGGSIVHRLSYQMARHYAIPVKGLMLASTGYIFSGAGLPRNAVLVEINGVPMDTLDDLDAVLATVPDGTEFSVRYFRPHEARRMEVASVTMDRRWFPVRRCQREDRTGGWPCTDAGPGPDRVPIAPRTATAFSAQSKAGKVLAASLVQVRFRVPLATDGARGRRFNGAGLVVDAEAGLVICDRDTVPVLLGDLHLTFGGSVEIPGEVVALHPAHNLAMVSYDPALLGQTPVRSVRFLDKSVSRETEVVLAAVRSSGQFVERKVKVDQVEALFVPFPSSPSFLPVHYELLSLRDPPASVGGAVADKSGRLLALWASFPDHSGTESPSWFRGIPAGVVEQMVRDFREGGSGVWRTMDVIWNPMSLREARRRGLPADAAARLEAADPERRKLLVAWSITREGPARGRLEEGDLLISLNGEPVTRFAEVEAASQVEAVQLEVFRDGEMVRVEVPTRAMGPGGTDRVVLWAGAILQAPHYPVSQQHHQPREGVYVATTWRGSPAGRYKIRPTRRIVEVDGRPTPDLDTFLQAVAGKADRQPVRLRMVDMDGRVRAKTLKLDLEYWPTEEVVRTADGWVRRRVVPAAR